MNVIAEVIGTLEWIVTGVAPFLVVLGVVVFVHEFGHYIVGRWCGIRAKAFSIGFGPEIVGWTDQRGTRWRLAWIPLGGYVMFEGDADAASAQADGAAIREMTAEERRATMAGAPLWARTATVAAGPMANFLFTMAIITGLTLAVGVTDERARIGFVDPAGQGYGAGLREGDEVLSIGGAPVESLADFVATLRDNQGSPLEVTVRRAGDEVVLPITYAQPTRVVRLETGGPAALACLKPGDVIQAVNGETVAHFSELQDAVTQSGGATLTFTIERAGEPLREVEITPAQVDTLDRGTGEFGQTWRIGVVAEDTLRIGGATRSAGLVEAVAAGVAAPFVEAAATLGYVWSIIMGDVGGGQIGGPIGIAKMSSSAAELGLVGFIVFIASISTAIGLINLFPIPVLDGGHLVFYAIEAVRGRPLSDRAMNAAGMIGLAALLTLMVFATMNDLSGTVASLGSECAE